MLTILAIPIIIVLLVVLVRVLKPYIYDGLIVHMTTPWYAEVFKTIPSNAKVLDVGVGTGGALVRNVDAIKEKALSIVGIDVDKHYVKQCRKVVEKAGLKDHVTVVHKSLFDYREPANSKPFGVVYFSDSLMLIPGPVQALKYASHLLDNSPDGRIYVTQTVEIQRRPWIERLKPYIKWLTTIDFGRVTYEHELHAQFKAAGLEMIKEVDLAAPLKGLGSSSNRKFLMIILKPSADNV